MENICSILVVTYKQEKYLKRALDSILSQKTKYSFQVDIFDDASPDNTAWIIKEYEDKYPNIVKGHIAEKNLGAQDNFWRAFESVKTKYFMILEGDDYWCHDSKLEWQIDALERNPECSFCGHNTYLYSLDEKFREYEEGALCCTQDFLKSKKVFSYKDFEKVYDGGYIPYVSARLIRSECIDLSKIKYKETVLFDFTQFYYLLLKGKYYYLDIPMSVYQRTGEGVCSGVSPMEFLNTFVSNAIDFNKDTGNVIADKIYSDIALQVDFRLKLYRENYLKQSVLNLDGTIKPVESGGNGRTAPGLLVMEESFNPQKYYFVLNGGLGFTKLLCSLKSALEKSLFGEIVFLVIKEHAFILDMYQIKDYIIVDLSGYDVEKISRQNPNPQKGKIYIAHPFAHEELESSYLPVLTLTSTQKFLPWISEIYSLDSNVELNMPVHEITLEKESLEKIKAMGDLSKVVLFLPNAHTVSEIEPRYWIKKAKELKEKGYTVYCASSTIKENIKGCNYIDLNAKEIVYVGTHCYSIYAIRNGFCDLLVGRGKDLTVVYPSHASHFIYSLNTDGEVHIVNEELVLEPLWKVGQSGNQNPLLFGIIRVPDRAYSFYDRHRESFAPFKKVIKKMIQWR